MYVHKKAIKLMNQAHKRAAGITGKEGEMDCVLLFDPRSKTTVSPPRDRRLNG
jgi:hypothetical protein